MGPRAMSIIARGEGIAGGALKMKCTDTAGTFLKAALVAALLPIYPPAFASKSLPLGTVQTALKRANGTADAVAAVIVSPTTFADGEWGVINGQAVWRLSISLPGATYVAVHASSLSLPPGSEVTLSGGGRQHSYSGAKLQRGRLWTSPVPGDTAILTVTLPSTSTSSAKLEIDSFDAGITRQGSGPTSKSFVVPNSADSDGDVNYECVRAEGNEKAGRATVNVNLRKPDLVTVSSGTLINNAAGDRKPFVIGARHAEEGPSYGTVDTTTERKFHWNATVPCGDSLDIAAAVHQTAESDGATVRAMFGDSILWELDDPVPAAAEAYFAGVDASLPTSSVQGRPARSGDIFFGVHHGGNGPKQYVEDQDSLICGRDIRFGEGNYCRDGDNAGCVAWIISMPPSSDYGRTVPGSSGSGLFDANNNILGTLVGGGAGGDCNSAGDILEGPDEASTYQALYTAWDGGGTPATALRFWLDAANTGNRVIGGLAAVPPPAPSATLTVAPATIVAGSTALITWNSTDATACTASGSWSGSKALTGSESTGTLSEGTYTYSLSCNGAGGSASKSATLRVTAAPPPGNEGSGGGGGGGAFDVRLLFAFIAIYLLRQRSTRSGFMNVDVK
jgi:hypothetical protein